MQKNDIRQSVENIAKNAKKASAGLRNATTAEKNHLLLTIASALREYSPDIISANNEDITRERAGGMAEGLIDRLTLGAERIENIAAAVEQVVALADPVGQIVRGSRLANGMQLREVRVPMGVIGMIYEARPNVTVDAAALAVKAGSAVILRGGSAALETNKVLVSLMRKSAAACGFAEDIIQTIDEYGREGGVELMKLRGLVDVVIPRGGAGLIRTVVRESLVPVIETGVGNCHVYVDMDADPTRALTITLNSKTHRPSVCNSAETLLIHAGVDETLTREILLQLHNAGVVLHVDETAAEIAGDIPTTPATPEDWDTEYLALEMAVKIVNTLEEAIEHIAEHSSGHTEAIISENVDAISAFTSQVDSAAVMVNASTRFTDGGEFGLGAEIGISTQKLHARGPMGLEEMTTTMWIAEGQGHVR